MNSALKELIADICVESGLEESQLDEGLTWKILAQRIGTTSLEAGTIAAYQQRLTEAKSGLMVSMLCIDMVSLLTSCSTL